MFSRPKPPLPPKVHTVSVRFGPMVEIKAEGLGLVVAPILTLIVVVVVVMGSVIGGDAALDRIGSIFSPDQAAPAVAERPPPDPADK